MHDYKKLIRRYSVNWFIIVVSVCARVCVSGMCVIVASARVVCVRVVCAREWCACEWCVSASGVTDSMQNIITIIRANLLDVILLLQCAPSSVFHIVGNNSFPGIFPSWV